MSLRRRVVVIGLLVFLGFSVYHSVVRWKSTVPLAAPAGATVTKAVYSCGALWSADSARGPASVPYKLEGTPCAHRSGFRLLSFLDVLVAVGGIAFVVARGRALRADDANSVTSAVA